MAISMLRPWASPALGGSPRAPASVRRLLLRHVLLSGLLALALAGGGSAAEGPAGGEPAGGGPRRLSLEEAVGLALERNPDVALAREALEKARVAAAQARDAADDLRPEMVASLDMAKVKELYPFQTEAGVRLAEKGVEAAGEGLRLRVEQAYFAAQLAGELVQVHEQAVALAEEQLRQARLAFKVGTRARTDVLAAEAQLAAAEADLAAARKDAAVAALDLNQVLALPLNEQVELTTRLAEPDEKSLPAVGEEEVRRAVERALSHSPMVSAGEGPSSVRQAEEELVVARQASTLTARYYTPNVYTYRQALADVHQAEVWLGRVRTATELEVRKAILEIGAARARVEQQRKAVALSEEGLRLAALRYRAGIGTSAEVLDAQVRLSGARAALANAVFALRMGLARYLYLVGE